MHLTRTLRRAAHAVSERTLAQHRAWADWQAAQSRLVERYVHELFAMSRASAEVGHAALQSMGRVMVDGLAPRSDR
jgi:hypothetical protein